MAPQPPPGGPVAPGALDRLKSLGRAQLLYLPLLLAGAAVGALRAAGGLALALLPAAARAALRRHLPEVSDAALAAAEDHILRAAPVAIRHDWREFTTPSGRWRMHAHEVGGDGDGSAEPLVLIHGALTGSLTWYPVLGGLAEAFPWIVLLDAPGNGRSVAPPELGTAADPQRIVDLFVEGIEGWRKARGVKRLHLVGHSYGGFLASLYAQRHPDRVSRLTLVAPGGQLPVAGPGSWAFAVFFSATPQAVFRALGPLGFHLFRVSLWRRLRLHMPAPFVHYYFQLTAARSGVMDITISRFMAFPCLRECLWNYPALGKTLDVQAPVTLVWGELDPVLNLSLGHLLHELAEGVDLHVVRGAGHNPAHSAPEQFCAVLQAVHRGAAPAPAGRRANPITASNGPASPVAGLLRRLCDTHLVDHKDRRECARRHEGATALFRELAQCPRNTGRVVFA